MDQILEEAQQRKCIIEEKAGDKQQDFEKTRLNKIAKQRLKETSSENFKTMNKNKDLELSTRKIDLETSEAQNQLYPPNMRDFRTT